MLDIGVNEPFKEYMFELCKDYMIANVNNAKVVQRHHHIAQWVNMAWWARVSIERIANTCRSAGFEGFAAVN